MKRFRVYILNYSGDVWKEVVMSGKNRDEVMKKLDHKFLNDDRVMGYVFEMMEG